MNSKQLRYFLATAEKGSITAAAKSLDIAQPAISQQLANLEHELSTSLFERDYRGVRLTSSGERFYQRAKSIVHQMGIAKAEIINTKSNPSGQVSIGMAQAACNALAIPLTEFVQQHFPNIQLKLHYGTHDLLNQWLTDGHIDLAVSYENASYNKDFSVTPLIKENIYLVVAAHNNDRYQSLVEQNSIEFKQLSKFEIILPDDKDPIVQMLNQHETQTGVRIWSKPNFGLLMTNLRYVTDGLGLMILPSSAIFHLEKSAQIKAINIVKPELNRDVILLNNTRHPKSISMQAVRKTVIELIKEAHSLGNWRGKLMC
jgi:LysR family nitrogen assimilation transcriptional regulator